MSSEEMRERVLQFKKQKDKIEEEIKQLTDILTHNGIGMNDPLVDDEGFPLSNVDIYQVRHARHRIICLQNDHKAVMKQIEDGLQGYYTNSSQTNSSQDVEMRPVDLPARTVHHAAFAKVSTVVEGSPAEDAGVHPGDLIIEFGSVNSENYKNITDIAAVVQHSENRPVLVRLKRGPTTISTQIVPRKWSGRGMLGCNIDSLAK